MCIEAFLSEVIWAAAMSWLLNNGSDQRWQAIALLAAGLKRHPNTE